MGPGAGPQPPKQNAGGLGAMTSIPSLDFEVGSGAQNQIGSGGGGYVPTFGVGDGASRRPRRMLG